MPSAKLLKTLNPGYFDIVMATGIVAVALQFEQVRWLAVSLAILNGVLFVLLFLLNFLRALFYPRLFFHDLGDFDRGPGFFTLVAATAILGGQTLVIFGRPRLAFVLWMIAIPLWICIMYAVFAEFTVNPRKPTLERGINGSWLLSVVATQSVADLGASLSRGHPVHQREILFFSLALWLAGGMIYVWLISLIFYRFTFFPFHARDFIPPFWINMGAMAISALSGTSFIAAAPGVRFLEQLLPFIRGFTLFFWATATWWIPMLLILAFWQHVVKGLVRAYSFLYWSAVFPLGMYSAASYRLAQAMELPFLLRIAQVFCYLSLAAWLMTFYGLLHSLIVREKLPTKPAYPRL